MLSAESSIRRYAFLKKHQSYAIKIFRIFLDPSHRCSSIGHGENIFKSDVITRIERFKKSVEAHSGTTDINAKTMISLFESDST